MHHAIGWIFELLLRWVFPSSGRHRSVQQTPSAPPRAEAPVAFGLREPDMPLRGEDIALVRPYRVAHERREEVLRPWRSGQAMVLAAHGVDLSALLAAEAVGR
ncbi:hypothetical protein [Streptomyces palmae]|uniref:hypothetical protein n=1 Tax=Streptomyces palmae TaxID=1701085 RepID=UPI00107ED637|nr:hypothetical protein [Streptomyces palmae]